MTPNSGRSVGEPRGSGGLGQRFLLGAVYIGAGSWLTYALNFAIQIAIARMLGPSEMGLYAYAFAINEFINIVGAFSLGAALIQAREEGQGLYDTGLALCAALGALGLLIALAAASVLWIWRSDETAWFLIAMAFVRIALLIVQVPNAELQRSLRFGQLSVIAMVSGNLPNLAALGFAAAGFGAWSLVLRDLGVAGLVLVLTAAWSGYRFRRCVDRESARRLMVFSRPMFVSRSLDIVLERVDRIAVGSFFGNTAMGLYHQARFLAEAGQLATRPIGQISFNLYARLQDSPEPLAHSYELLQYFLLRVTFMGAVVLIVAPAETVRLLLGDAWIEMAPLLRGFGLYAAILPVFENSRNLLYGLGEVGRNVRIRLVQIVAFLPGLLLGCWVESLLIITLSVTGITILAFAMALYFSRDLVRRPPVGILATPVALLLGVSAVFAAGEAVDLLAAVPWFVRPFLPAAVFLAALLVVERTSLLHKFRFLRAHLLSGTPDSAQGDESASVADHR